MLNNPIKQQSVIAVGTVGATIAGGVVAPVLAAALGIAVVALGYLGSERSQELFNTDELIDRVNKKIQQSENFASFVFDVWQRYNFESSEERRELLKQFLKTESVNNNNQFENFSEILDLIQNISFYELSLLKKFYKYCTELDDKNSQHDSQNVKNNKTAQLDMQHIFEGLKLDSQVPESSYAINAVNRLASRGLIKLEYRGHGRNGSPWYAMNLLGKLFLEVING